MTKTILQERGGGQLKEQGGEMNTENGDNAITRP